MEAAPLLYSVEDKHAEDDEYHDEDPNDQQLLGVSAFPDDVLCLGGKQRSCVSGCSPGSHVTEYWCCQGGRPTTRSVAVYSIHVSVLWDHAEIMLGSRRHDGL